MIRLAIFASGSGTNAENIIRYFAGHSLITVALVVSNRAEARVLEKAARHKVPSVVIEKSHWTDPSAVIAVLDRHQIDYIILAGFLLKVHPEIIRLYPNKIINIHPALLPRYGGRGMYGERVHQAVLENGDQTSGITIHLVNEEYDAGRIIFQCECDVGRDDTPATLARKVHDLEYRHYPKVIENYIFPSVRQA